MTSKAEQCCIHYDSVKEKKLIILMNKESWETLLSAARIRKNKEILRIANTMEEAEIPILKYHKTYRCMFVLKRSLQKIQQNVGPESSTAESSRMETKRKRDGFNSRGMLSKVSIFCKKESKYVSGINTGEKLYCCAKI